MILFPQPVFKGYDISGLRTTGAQTQSLNPIG